MTECVSADIEDWVNTHAASWLSTKITSLSHDILICMLALVNFVIRLCIWSYFHHIEMPSKARYRWQIS